MTMAELSGCSSDCMAPQSLKYLLSGTLLKKLPNPWARRRTENREMMWTVIRADIYWALPGTVLSISHALYYLILITRMKQALSLFPFFTWGN